jgi:DNA replication protein DnaC
MIITTNLSMQKLATESDLSDKRVYDRIIERCFPIEVKGGSRRRKAVREGYEDMKKLLGL